MDKEKIIRRLREVFNITFLKRSVLVFFWLAIAINLTAATLNFLMVRLHYYKVNQIKTLMAIGMKHVERADSLQKCAARNLAEADSIKNEYYQLISKRGDK